jgi:hypothetical protein
MPFVDRWQVRSAVAFMCSRHSAIDQRFGPGFQTNCSCAEGYEASRVGGDLFELFSKVVDLAASARGP